MHKTRQQLTVCEYKAVSTSVYLHKIRKLYFIFKPDYLTRMCNSIKLRISCQETHIVSAEHSTLSC